MDLKTTYNKIASDWAKDHAGDAWWIDGVNKFISFLPKEATILDVGCGPGEKSQLFIEKGFNVFGIDFSENMIEIAQKKVPRAKFSIKDIKNDLLFDVKFDGVFAQAVLLHIPKMQIDQALENIVKPLKKGGYLYVTVKKLKDNHLDEEIVKENDYGYDYERFFSYFTPNEIRNYLLQIGMEICFEALPRSTHTEWIQIIARK